MAGAGEAEGSGGPHPPSNEERLQQIKEEAELKQRQVEHLSQELAKAEQEWNQHAKIHQLPVKGKEPE